MSQENVETALRGWAAWNIGDLDGAISDYDPDVVIVAPTGWPDGDVVHGVEAWRRQAQSLRETWESARIEVDEIRPVGEEKVFARIRYVTQSKETGIWFVTPMGVVFTFRDGKIVHVQWFREITEAARAAGLSE